ncbi:GNAT family N-acetyltransferase [Saccharopolyspora griseoalba]|uniref:GNAT family N-acetyltransferase n=1 Tax=Saccharopolyspora griseoalba TaxID=1431848 RepID=A0ABW2LNF4_9PSEU
MPSAALQRINASRAAFARRRAARSAEVPGGFAVYDEAFARSRADNQLIIDGAVDGEALPAIAEGALGHLPHRSITVLDETVGAAVADPLRRAGYVGSTQLIMVHVGRVPTGGSTEVVDLAELSVPLELRLRGMLPDAEDEVVRQLVDRREARRRAAEAVLFLGARTRDGELAFWADLYLDPATGTAQVEDLITAEPHLRRGHAGAVLNTALRLAADASCGIRFLIADAQDWPHQWYERRGFSVVGRSHSFERR